MKKGLQTRRDIVHRALGMASEVGLEGVTLGTLAEALALSKSGLFAHFKSKEALQLAVLEEATARFVDIVMRPALAAPRGERRLRALFEYWMQWMELDRAGGRRGHGARCIFLALSQEYDDRPGEVRDAVIKSQRDWRKAIARAAAICVEEKQFRKSTDVDQVAFEFVGIGMTYQQTRKLLGDPMAKERAIAALDALMARERVRRRVTPRRRPESARPGSARGARDRLGG